MRRLFCVLDLSLLRQPDEEQRQAVLERLTVAVGRLWAAYQPGDGGGGGAPGRHVSWGYALYDSACPELLLKPQLRNTAKALSESCAAAVIVWASARLQLRRAACSWHQLFGSATHPTLGPGVFLSADLPPAFQETIQTDCRGKALKQFLKLIDAATQPSAAAAAAAAADGPAPSGSSEAPAAALVRALQSALGSSYLKKLQEMADSDSSSGAGGVRPEGLLAVFSPGLSSVAALQRFLGPAAETELAAVAAAGSQQEQQAGLQRLLAAALPAAVWQRCGAGALRVCWVAVDAAASDDQPLPVLPALQDAMQQHCRSAAAAPLAEVTGECSSAVFAARLSLPQRAAGEVQQAAAGGAEGPQEEVGWPAAADGSYGMALKRLKVVTKLYDQKGVCGRGVLCEQRHLVDFSVHARAVGVVIQRAYHCAPSTRQDHQPQHPLDVPPPCR